MPKFYFFDVGIANFLACEKVVSLSGALAGKSLENLIAMELMAYRSLSRKLFDIGYWRTKTGLEVDFILGQAKVALEVKISQQVHLNKNLSQLRLLDMLKPIYLKFAVIHYCQIAKERGLKAMFLMIVNGFKSQFTK